MTIALAAIVLAAEHLPRFRRVDFLLQLVERARRGRRSTSSPASAHSIEDADVVGRLRQRFEQRPIFLEPPAALHHFCASAWLLQKSGAVMRASISRELFVEVGALKDASAARAIACSGLRTPGRDRRWRQPTHIPPWADLKVEPHDRSPERLLRSSQNDQANRDAWQSPGATTSPIRE